MPSVAVGTWRADRTNRLDAADGVHQLAINDGAAPIIEYASGAWVVRIAAEFQGFCRDLHNEAARVFGTLTRMTGIALNVVVQSFQMQRGLDGGNPNVEVLRRDFLRFGIDLWTAMDMYDDTSPRLREQLQRLLKERNSVVHGGLATFDRPRMMQYRTAVDRLASNLDAVVSIELGLLFGEAAPW
jgi:hypothetical protein